MFIVTFKKVFVCLTYSFYSYCHRFCKTENMEEFQVVYSTLILHKGGEMDLSTMRDQVIVIQKDASYTIGRSVAVLCNDRVIGHLPRGLARPAWMQLHCGLKLEGTLYHKLDCGFQNSIRYSFRTKAFEVGIALKFFFCDSIDGGVRISGGNEAKSFLAFVLRHRLNTFPGVTLSNWPPELRCFLN